MAAFAQLHPAVEAEIAKHGTVGCHGKCKKRKAPFLFSPGSLRKPRPECIACRKLDGDRRRINPRPRSESGFAFRRDANSLCAGSARALERAEKEAA